MQEYNFEPDYAKWWEKKKLSKEEICWLVLGVNPTDATRYENLKKEEDKKKISDGDKEWQQSFTRYIDMLPYGFESYSKHDLYMKILLWEGDKNDIVKQVYESYHDFPENFRAFLGKGFPKDKKLEAYKNHENFKPDETLSLDKITKEEDAFAVLLGFKPKDFSRFYALEQRQKNEPKDENGHGAYVRFTPDEKWFYSEYRRFIADSYEGQDFHGFAITAWDEARFLEVRKGDFKEYAQRLYNEGFIFKRSVIESLQAKGIFFEYDEKGWAYEFYRYWLKKGGWTASEAVALFKGQYPKNEGRSLIDLSQNPYLLSASHSNMIFSWDNHMQNWERLEQILERHKAMGIVTAHPMKEVELFEPKEITEWLLKQTLHIPPKPLLTILGIDETKEQEENRQIEAERARPQPLKMYPLYEWAMPFFDKYTEDKKRNPTKSEVATYLKEEHNLDIAETSIERELSAHELKLKYQEYKKEHS